MFFKTCALSTHTSRMQAAVALSAWGLFRYPTCKGRVSGWQGFV